MAPAAPAPRPTRPGAGSSAAPSGGIGGCWRPVWRREPRLSQCPRRRRPAADGPGPRRRPRPRGGKTLSGGDLREANLPADAVPDGAVTAPAAVSMRVLAGAMRSGEVITDVRIVSAPLLAAAPAGTVASPVRIADAASVRLLRSGDLVDVLAAETAIDASGVTAGAAVVVAGGVRVLAVPAVDDGYGGSLEGALIVLATTTAEALDLATAAVTARLSITLRAG